MEGRGEVREYVPRLSVSFGVPGVCLVLLVPGGFVWSVELYFLFGNCNSTTVNDMFGVTADRSSLASFLSSLSLAHLGIELYLPLSLGLKIFLFLLFSQALAPSLPPLLALSHYCTRCTRTHSLPRAHCTGRGSTCRRQLPITFFPHYFTLHLTALSLATRPPPSIHLLSSSPRRQGSTHSSSP